MDRRRILSDVPEPQLVEKSPLIDPRKLRSCRELSRSASVTDSGTIYKRASSTIKSNSLKPISELGQQPQSLNSKYCALNRSQSAPHYLRSPHYTAPGPQHLRSPLYRVNPVVKFDDRALPPQRMNYGIAGYNTSRPRPHSFSSIPETAIATTRPRSVTTIPESPGPKPRPRSFSSVPESASRPRSLISRSGQTPRPAVRAVVWRSLTRRFRDKMGRIRVRDTCSKLLSRFRG